MKASAATLAAILALSLAVWVLFYALTPDTPLTPPETLVVVGASAGVVLLARWIWSRRRKAGGASGESS